MVARFLSAAGWQVRTELPRTVEEVVAAARSNWFAVAGLTGLLPVSRTPGLGVMMGPEVIHAASQVRA